MNKKYILSLLSLAAVPAFAQMDNTVEVETSVTPIVKDANKINVLPQVLESETVHNAVNYSTKLMQTKKYVFAPMDMMSSETLGNGAGKGFLSLGAGVSGNLDMHGAYGFNLSKNDVLGFRFSVDGHSNTGAKVPNLLYDNTVMQNLKAKSRFYTTRGGADYTHKYDGGLSEFYMKLGLESQVFNYQFPVSKETNKQHNSIGGIKIGTTDYKSSSFRINGEFDYDFFNQKYITTLDKKNSEAVVRLNTDFGVYFNEENSINLDFGVSSSSYGMKKYDSYTHAHILPYYLFEDYDFTIKAGLMIGAGGLAPDVRFDYHATESFDLYVQARGYETENNFNAFTSLNPYAMLAPVADEDPKVKIRPEFHKIDVKGGFRFRSSFGLAGDVNLGYDKSENRAELTILNKMDNNAYLAFVDGGRFYVNIDLIYNANDAVKFDLRNQINAWSVDKEFKHGIVMARPVVDLDWNVDVRAGHGFFIGADVKIQGYNKPKDKKKLYGLEEVESYVRPTTFDFGLTGHYVFGNLPLSIYANIDNLFNVKYDRFYGYRALGTNFIIGAAYTF